MKYADCINCGFRNFHPCGKCLSCGNILHNESKPRTNRSVNAPESHIQSLTDKEVLKKLKLGKHVFRKPPDTFKPYKFS